MIRISSTFFRQAHIFPVEAIGFFGELHNRLGKLRRFPIYSFKRGRGGTPALISSESANSAEPAVDMAHTAAAQDNYLGNPLEAVATSDIRPEIPVRIVRKNMSPRKNCSSFRIVQSCWLRERFATSITTSDGIRNYTLEIKTQQRFEASISLTGDCWTWRSHTRANCETSIDCRSMPRD